MNNETVILRPFLPGDQDRMLEILTDNTVNKTYMLPDFAQKEDAIPLFQRLKSLSCDENRFVRCIDVQGNVVGFINDVVVKDGSIELGYVIHPDSQGKGYMTAALKTAIHTLLDFKFTTVICGAFEENAASMRVMEKCGMHRLEETEIIDYRGKEHLCIYYTISKEE